MVLSMLKLLSIVHRHIKFNLTAASNDTLSNPMFRTLIAMLNHFFVTRAMTIAQTT